MDSKTIMSVLKNSEFQKEFAALLAKYLSAGAESGSDSESSSSSKGKKGKKSKSKGKKSKSKGKKSKPDEVDPSKPGASSVIALKAFVSENGIPIPKEGTGKENKEGKKAMIKKDWVDLVTQWAEHEEVREEAEKAEVEEVAEAEVEEVEVEAEVEEVDSETE